MRAMQTNTHAVWRSRSASGAAVLALALGLTSDVAVQGQTEGAILKVRLVPELTVSGVVGSTYQIQYVNAFGDINRWLELTNLALTSSPLVWYDPISATNPLRFYRALTVPLGCVWIPAGMFTMGSPNSEVGRKSDEGPQTAVTITHGFFMGQCEVTQGQYEAVMASNPSTFGGDANRPVETVTWQDATNYCGKLTAAERAAGRLPFDWVYRLPTEAEWEYASRAGTTTRFSWPDTNNIGDYAWYLSNSGGTTHPVGLKQPNAWGLYDTAGNVLEWCLDWYGTYPGGSVTDPEGPSSGTDRTVRGGCGGYPANDCRVAGRWHGAPSSRDRFADFRVVVAAIQPPGFVWIPPGKFTMGSPPTEQDRYDNEGPQTVVTLTTGFFMCQHEVTQGEYKAVTGSNPSWFQGDLNRPVEMVTWNEATNYCYKLTAAERAAGRLRTGYAYRLPTEAEWEYACRAGTTTRFSYGDDPGYVQLGDYCWYTGNADGQTHPVGQKRTNPWGLCDMHGNVFEWCLDYWAAGLPGGSLTDPVGPQGPSSRVIRGGSWANYARGCRSAMRSSIERDSHLGFRVVLDRVRP